MGKNRVVTIGDEGIEEQEKQKKALKKSEKKAREAAQQKSSEETDEKPQAHEPQEEKVSEDIAQETASEDNIQAQDQPEKKEKKQKKDKFAKTRARSANYNSKIVMIDKNKNYSLSEALELLKQVRLAKFDEAVELHINTLTDGISGQVKLPHGTGKEVKVAIADDAVISQIEKGKIEFDVLVSTPDMMPKLAKVARVLGPKGLMPNPKNGTISANPQDAAKAFQGGQIHFKTEAKLPVMHMVVGRISFEQKQLEENIQTALSKVGKDKIRKVVLKSSMSPAIKLQV